MSECKKVLYHAQQICPKQFSLDQSSRLLLLLSIFLAIFQLVCQVWCSSWYHCLVLKQNVSSSLSSYEFWKNRKRRTKLSKEYEKQPFLPLNVPSVDYLCRAKATPMMVIVINSVIKIMVTNVLEVFVSTIFLSILSACPGYILDVLWNTLFFSATEVN